jgi:hypothetical protein
MPLSVLRGYDNPALLVAQTGVFPKLKSELVDEECDRLIIVPDDDRGQAQMLWHGGTSGS